MKNQATVITLMNHRLRTERVRKVSSRRIAGETGTVVLFESGRRAFTFDRRDREMFQTAQRRKLPLVVRYLDLPPAA